jgi:hypothetical protein
MATPVMGPDSEDLNGSNGREGKLRYGVTDGRGNPKSD